MDGFSQIQEYAVSCPFELTTIVYYVRKADRIRQNIFDVATSKSRAHQATIVIGEPYSSYREFPLPSHYFIKNIKYISLIIFNPIYSFIFLSLV